MLLEGLCDGGKERMSNKVGWEAKVSVAPTAHNVLNKGIMPTTERWEPNLTTSFEVEGDDRSGGRVCVEGEEPREGKGSQAGKLVKVPQPGGSRALGPTKASQEEQAQGAEGVVSKVSGDVEKDKGNSDE